MLGEVGFKLRLGISSKVNSGKKNLIDFGGVLLGVKLVDQLDLHQVGPKLGPLPMEELHAYVVFDPGRLFFSGS